MLAQKKMAISVHQSAQFIAKNSQHVKINDDKIKEFCQSMFSPNNLPQVNFNHVLHPNCSKDKDFMSWIFIIDSLNFCFWSSDEPQCWTVTYENICYSGYFALCAALKKAKDGGLNITDPEVTSKISLETFKDLMKGDGGVLPNLLKERHRFLIENSNILLMKHQGSFKNVVKNANRSAKKLLSVIIEDFPSFRDESMFLGTRVAFYKRAQILVADLFFCASSTLVLDDPCITPCMFEDIEQLTMFADYRVPQVLKYFGILEYSEELAKAIREPVLLDPDSRFENELRGNSIEAVERIVHSLNLLYSSRVNAVTVDVFLWNYRREHAELVEKEPYHRVISVYY